MAGATSLRFLREDTLLHDIHFTFDDGEERGAHRCVLAFQSPVFRAMFDPNSPLHASSTVPLVDKRCADFDVLLEYCYSSDAKLVTGETAAPLLTLAEEYQVLKLKKECEGWLIENVGPETCVDCLLLAQRYRGEELEAASKSLLVKEFEAVALTEGFGRLPASLLVEALAADSLFVSSEESVFESCTRWVGLQPPPPDADAVASLFQQVGAAGPPLPARLSLSRSLSRSSLLLHASSQPRPALHTPPAAPACDRRRRCASTRSASPTCARTSSTARPSSCRAEASPPA